MPEKVFPPTLPDYPGLREKILHQEGVRPGEEALNIFDFLQSIQTDFHGLFSRHPALSSLFEEDFKQRFEDFVAEDTILNLALFEEAIFGGQRMPYGPGGEGLEEHGPLLREWIESREKAHMQEQNRLREKFKEDLRIGQLGCPCPDCLRVFKEKMTDILYEDASRFIDKAQGEMGAILEESFSESSGAFRNLREKITAKMRRARKILKGTWGRKLEKKVETYLREVFLEPGELGQKRSQGLRDLFAHILGDMGVGDGFLEEEEIKKAFAPTSFRIWRGRDFLEKEFRKQVSSLVILKRKDISGKILQDYLGEFWIHSLARTIKRKITYHMGPTNSGKTYYAIEKLSKAPKGCYLAPLRLLAGELYDTLNARGVGTTLLTGEEVIEVEGATHYASTIEMARLQEFFDCCVIDEIQMITDPQRGWAWTRAFVNIFSEEIHLCGDSSVLELVKEITALCGDELTISNYERMTQLKVEDRPIKIGDLRRSDALVVFSRRNALRFKRELEDLDFKVSIVYGRLSPEVRREQARKFDEEETDIMVSTDAIAMGMNLPIRRLVFSTFVKYIDSEEFPISESEIKQIAGRAGRYKRFSTGYVTCLSKAQGGTDIIKRAMAYELPQQTKCMVGPDLDIFDQVNKALTDHGLSRLKLSEFLRLFHTISFKKPFFCVDLREMIELSEMVEESDEKGTLNSAEIFGFACAPVNMGLPEHIQYFHSILKGFIGGGPIVNRTIDEKRSDIDYLETSIKCVELYQWLSRHFNNKHFDFSERDLLENKSSAIEKLNSLLSEKIVLTCSSCGCKLPEKSSFSICEDCFEQLRYNRRRRRGVGGHRRKAPPHARPRTHGKAPRAHGGRPGKKKIFKGRAKKSKRK